MVPDAEELLTPVVRKRFLGDRASLLALVVFFGGAVLVLVGIVFVSPAVEDPARYEALRRKGKFAEAQIDKISVAITEGRGSSYTGRRYRRVLSYKVSYRFEVGGKVYRGTHYVEAKYVESGGMREGASFLALYDPANPANNVITTWPASTLKGLEETGLTEETLREKVEIPRGGIPSWVLLLLYLAFLGLVFGGGFWVWRRMKAARIFTDPVVVPALLVDREAVFSSSTSRGRRRERLSGYRMRLKTVSHAGVPLELRCTTSRRGEAAALSVGSVVTLIYERAHPKNFMLYELYGDRVVEWDKTELKQALGDLYTAYKERHKEEEESIKPGRYGLGPSEDDFPPLEEGRYGPRPAPPDRSTPDEDEGPIRAEP